MKRIRNSLPDEMWLGLILLITWQSIVYIGPRLITPALNPVSFSIAWDDAIPFLPWTVSIYILSYVYWIVNCYLSVRFDRERAYRFLSADFLAKGIGLFCFIFLHSTLRRPSAEGNGFWLWVIRLIYAVDTPDRLLPSFHCLLSWLCYLGVKGEKRIPKAYQVFSCLFALAIFLSTLTVKQHVIADVISGWLIAEICYRLCGNPRITDLYKRFLAWTGARLSRGWFILAECCIRHH